MSSKKIKQLKRKLKQYTADNILEFMNGLEKENFALRFKVAMKILFYKYRLFKKKVANDKN